jgi:pullulanase/glycogen debranching enzyme
MTSPNSNQKISAMLLEVADGYIQMGKTVAERENLLRGAVTAWNIACQPESMQEGAIQNLLKQFMHFNPTSSQSNLSNFEDDMRQLIKQKNRLYPDVKTQILGCQIELKDGKDNVSVQFARTSS